MNDIKLLLKNSKFLYLWISQMFSQVTVNIMNFLLLAKLFTETGSSIATSFLWLAFALPAIFFGPIGAACVDLVSKRKMLMITNLLQALTILILIFVHTKSIFVLYIAVLVYSSLNQFYVPAESASLPSVVSKKNLSHANSLFFITQQTSLIIGFGVAGIIQKLVGFNGSLVLCSVFLFISFISVSFLNEMRPRKEIPETFEKIFKTFFETILEGYEFIKSRKTILFPLLLLLGIQIGLAIAVVSLPIIATQILNASVNLAGLYIVVPVGIGAILGSIFVSKILRAGMRKRKLIEICLGLAGTSVLLLSLLTPFLPGIIKIGVSFILIAAIGFGFVGVNIPTFTYLQETTPSGLRGRVFGNFWFLVTIVTVLPVLFSGAITEFFGVRILFAILAAGVLGALVYIKKRGSILMEYEKQ